MRLCKREFYFLILLGASGCIKIPEHDLAPLFTSAEVGSEIAQAVDSGIFAYGDWPSRTWWKELDDSILTDLIEAGLKNNPDLLAADMRVKKAAQVALQKRAALFPEIDLYTTDNWEHLARQGFFRAFAPMIPAVVNDFNFDFTFNYQVDFWGKYRDLFNAAMGEAAAQAAEKLQAELLLSTAIAYEYSQLQFLLKEKEILLARDANRQAILGVRERRTENALDTSIQQLQSKASTLNVQSTIVEIDPQIAEQIHKLKMLSALGQDAVLEIPYRPLNALQIALPENLSLDLISRRPDLIAQRSRVEAAANRIDAAKTDFYPNVNLSAFIGLESVFWSKLLRKENYSSSLEPALNLPIFTAGRLKAQLVERVVEFNEAVFVYDNLILLAAREVADSLTAISFLQKEIEIREVSLQVAKRQEYLTRRRLEHALDNKIGYLEAQNQVLETELLVATLEYGKQLAGILLIRALGGGYDGGGVNGCP